MTSIAMANIPSGNIISLVNLVTYLDSKKKKRSIDNLEQRKKVKKIFYPTNFQEFEKLIKKFI